MHRYVGVLFALLAVNSTRVLAAGNIGCLFSDTLCGQEHEWCFDDHAFGHCLPHYGHYREEDLHRYELGPEELRLLEQQMQKLFLLGYRWSHTYTQCVLQELLQTIRKKNDFDISSCNGDVDQDLEGALKAIEGEELEQVDPRDLAIVRFTPSATDPHSDYADEVYFPPIKDQLLQDHLSPDHHNEEDNSINGGDSEQDMARGDHQESPTSEPGASNGRPEGNRNANKHVSPLHQQGGIVDALPVNPPRPPQHMDDAQPMRPYDPRQQNYINAYGPSVLDSYDDVDDDLSSTYHHSPYFYQPPMNAHKRARPSDMEFARSDDENDLGESIRRGGISSAQLRKIASLMETISRQKPLLPETKQRLLYPDRLQNGIFNDREDLDNEGVFGESPTRPVYTEAGRQFIPEVEDDNDIVEQVAREALLSNMPQDFRMGPEIPRGIPDEFRSILDTFPLSNGRGNNYGNSFRNVDTMRNQPEAMRNLPDSLRNLQMDNLDMFSNVYGPINRPPPQEFRIPELMREENVNMPRNYFMLDSNPYEQQKDELLPPWQNLMLDDDDNGDVTGFQGSDFENSIPRDDDKLTALEEAFGPQLSSIRDDDDFEYTDYGDYGTTADVVGGGGRGGGGGRLPDDYGEYGLYEDGQRLLPRNRAFPFLQKLDKKDEERAGGDYDDMVQPRGRSFQRPERLDVKKPGPGFGINSFAFNDGSPDAQRFMQEVGLQSPDGMGRSGGGGLFLPKLLMDMQSVDEQRAEQQQQEEEENQEVAQMMEEFASPQNREVPDVLLADQGIVEDPSDGIAGPKAERWLDKNDDSATTTEAPSTEAPIPEVEGPNSYVYITISGSFKTRKEGSDLAGRIVQLAGLSDRHVKNLSVDEDQVMFQVQENRKGIKASDVAKKAEELQGQLETETGHSINQAGVGTKTAMSALYFSSSEKHILAASAIVCGVMAALLVAASVLFFLRKHAKSKDKILSLTAHDTEASKDYEHLCRERMGKSGDTGKGDAPTTQVPSQRLVSLSKDSDNGNNSPSSRSSTSSWSEEPVASNMDISTGHMVLSYMEDHLKNKDRLEQEWIALCAYEAEPCATTLAMKPEHSKKNRYPDSVPYDHNRVVLNAHANVNGSDYINASSITDHDPRNPAYIATQGPLSNTAADFWQLVWEQGSVVIVMLTRLTENGHAFCHRYWPEEGSDLYHIYEVHLVSEHIWCDDYLVRSFYLKNVKTGETRTVTQFHFLSWPDSGTPASTKALLEFRRKVNKSYRGRSCPIIVHCSNGVGRTGTYCLIDMVLNRMAKGAKEIDIAATLEHIRDQRPNMVKSKGQFEFVLMAVAEEVHAILKALPQ